MKLKFGDKDLKVALDRERPMVADLMREIFDKVARAQDTAVEKALTEFYQEHGRWPEFAWVRVDASLKSVSVLAFAGDEMPEPDHTLAGRMTVWRSGFLNDRTIEGEH